MLVWSVIILQCFIFASAAELSFLVLGDWGKGGYKTAQVGMMPEEKISYQISVARAMANYSSNTAIKPSFIVALGDNFYDDGVSSSTDTLWLSLWKYVYLLDYPDLYIPWYPVLGNHDWNGNPQAQVQRFRDHTDDDIWMAESTNFTKTFPIPGSKNAYIMIVFLDTTTLAPSETKTTSQYSSSVKSAWIENQLKHLHTYLSAATSAAIPPTWIFVAGHYPVFSCGDHGDIAELNAYLLPVLQQYGVTAYFSGHDHISEHLTHEGIDYFVAGAGSMTDSLKATSQASLLWSGTGYCAFGVVRASTNAYTVSFVDTNNEVKYEATRYKTGAALSPAKEPTHGGDTKSNQSISHLLSSYQRVPMVVIGGTALSLLFLLTLGYVLYRGKGGLGVKSLWGKKKRVLWYLSWSIPTRH